MAQHQPEASSGSYPELQPGGPLAGDRIAIVASSWYPEIMRGLLAGSQKCLERFELNPDAADVFHVPGSFELPQAVARIARLASLEAGEVSAPRYSGIVALGCVIKGETDHYDVLVHAIAGGITRLSIELPMPVSFGVLTCQDFAQAHARSGDDHMNKGYEAMLALLDMMVFQHRLG
ncbi:6,7-dimethyl-8-ribityllumazine synthase [bacterium]|nr:6,7-dimethyl-8-ribityllumazine synthase [bacterium]